MAVRTIDAKGRRREGILGEVDDALQSGDELVLNLGPDVHPQQILRKLSYLSEDYRVDLVIRHVELREYLEYASTGAAIGAGVGAAGAVLVALKAGNPISLAVVLAAAGIGAIVGALVGGAFSTAVTVTVYKHRGQTKVRIAQAT